uniref:Phospholipase A2 n=1 Tax=Sphenodon punctatus TaxID=8508 RepID=A0A8D0G9J9_SPHPU
LRALHVLAELTMARGAGLWDLNRMIKIETGKHAFPNYSTYGCYCGWGGKGQPMDETDWCCHQHDCCYEKLDKRGCRTKTDSYHFFHLFGKVYCGLGSWCEKQICECDRTLVLCLKEHMKSYKKRYRYYRNSQCKGKKPWCS